MADEIHETRAPDGTTHTTTIIDREPRRGGMGFGLILLVLVAVVGFVAFQLLANDESETGAITEAAQKVGNAAENVGDAAQKAVE